jgi:hypothetical protein
MKFAHVLASSSPHYSGVLHQTQIILDPADCRDVWYKRNNWMGSQAME